MLNFPTHLAVLEFLAYCPNKLPPLAQRWALGGYGLAQQWRRLGLLRRPTVAKRWQESVGLAVLRWLWWRNGGSAVVVGWPNAGLTVVMSWRKGGCGLAQRWFGGGFGSVCYGGPTVAIRWQKEFLIIFIPGKIMTSIYQNFLKIN